MKYALAIVLLSVPTLLAAGERCAHTNHSGSARSLSAMPSANRAVVVRTQKIRPLPAWQRAVLFDPQIL